MLGRVAAMLITTCACGRVGFTPRDLEPGIDGASAIDGAIDGVIDGGFDLTACPPSYGETFASTGYRYRRVTTLRTWDGALQTCRQDQLSANAPTHLITLASDAERIEMAAGQAADTPWIGLSDLRTEGVFLAITLEDVGGYPVLGTSAWFPGEPNNNLGSEHCADMKPDGTVNDSDCSTSRVFTCECDPYPDTPSQY